MRQIRRYTKSGEHFACDPTEHTMSAMLHKSELDKPMSDYELDHDLTAADLENSTVIREGRPVMSASGSYFIRTWTRSLHGERIAEAERKLKKLDPDFLLVAEFSAPGNEVKMWLERPNDGRNDNLDQRELNRAAVSIVTDLLNKAGR